MSRTYSSSLSLLAPSLGEERPLEGDVLAAEVGVVDEAEEWVETVEGEDRATLFNSAKPCEIFAVASAVVSA